MHVYKRFKYFLSSLFLQNLIFPSKSKLKTSVTTLIKIISCENTGKKLGKTSFVLKMIQQSVLLNLTHLMCEQHRKERSFQQLSRKREKSKRNALPSFKEHGTLSTDITFYSKLS